MAKDAEYWITRLGLTPHPEGGYFEETYRSPVILPQSALPARYGADRRCATAIYFLLRSGQASKFHRLQSDELWCYHAGGALTLVVIGTDGALQRILLGATLDNGEQPQVLIKHGVWFGALVNAPNDYTLVSCLVAPGFEFADFELATPAQLLAAYPQHREIIERLT